MPKETTVEERFLTAINRTWQYISADAFEEESSLRQAVVIEITLDAGRVEFHGDLSDEDLVAWKALSYDEMIDLAKKALPYKTFVA